MHQLVHVPEGYGASVGWYLQHLEVRVNPALSERTVPTDAARGSFGAQQEPRDGHGRGELADVRETGDEVGVAEASLLEASLNQVEDPAMPDDVWWAGA